MKGLAFGALTALALGVAMLRLSLWLATADEDWVKNDRGTPQGPTR